MISALGDFVEKIFLIVFLVLLILANACPAYAYLDPGSGSMLIYALFGILVTIVYALRGIVYRGRQLLMGGTMKSVGKIAEAELVFFSEGGKYWNVFAPIIEALDKKGIKCAYVTPDMHDEGLKYKSDNVIIKGFKSELKAITFMNYLTANIVVSTTPQLDVYMLKRSKNVKHYSHVFHAPGDIALYEKHAFDYYDSVLCSGPHQIKSIRILENKRASKKKQLYETGCTYYDVMVKELTKKSLLEKKKLTVLYAPSWGRNSSLVKYGVNLLRPLLNDKFNLIFRPHPQMLTTNKKLMDELTSYLKAYDSVTLDREPSCQISMAASDIMITDISDIIFDYAFLFCKPTIVLNTVVEYGGYEAEDLEEVWDMTIRPKLCRILQESDIQQLSDIVLEEIENTGQRQLIISEIKNQFLYNFGNAGAVAANQLIEINNRLNAN
jgi:hypothetical protein